MPFSNIFNLISCAPGLNEILSITVFLYSPQPPVGKIVTGPVTSVPSTSIENFDFVTSADTVSAADEALTTNLYFRVAVSFTLTEYFTHSPAAANDN